MLTENQQATVTGSDLELLNTEGMKVEEGPAGSVRLTLKDRCYLRATAVWAFPFSERRHWIAFRDADDAPLGMLRDSHDLDKASRKVLMRALERRYFLPKIQRVISAREEFGLMTADVETDRGRIEFTVNNPRENIHWIGRERVLFVDAEDNRYEIISFENLDAKSRAMLANVI